MPFGNEFLYNHPACLLGVFNWDERVKMVSGRRQVVRKTLPSCLKYTFDIIRENGGASHIPGSVGASVSRVLSQRPDLSSLSKENRETTQCTDHIKAN